MRLHLFALGLISTAMLSQGQTTRLAASEIIVGAQNLKGVKAMSVVVVVEGIRDIPESAYRSDIESKLKAAGITVLPPTVDPHTYPFLGLVVTASFIRSQNNNLLGSLVVCQLQFDQLIPATVGSQPKYVRAITWESDSNYAFGPSIGIVSQLRELYRGMIDEFVRQYKTANIR